MLYIPFGQLLVRGKKRRNLSMMVRLKRLFKEVPVVFTLLDCRTVDIECTAMIYMQV